ncbi:MAG: NAD(P)(+) transhydrogenase (Re/Si-specific) subunit beta [Acholeplasmataceae bacterium]|jgi:NAD(P) transhydrogenase subunit beta|nr:NAD(P)(+) transhydrogenase (Re/Si-specific) subunit beta [Acholeplasmataceae bacterium]
MNNIFDFLTTPVVEYVISGVLVLLVMYGIFLMGKVKSARLGNGISSLSMLLAVIFTLISNDILDVWLLYVFLLLGLILSVWIITSIKMIQTPQLVATLNGFGGLASTIVGIFALYEIGSDSSVFGQITAIVALLVGMLTFVGSVIAALKLAQKIKQKSFSFSNHTMILSGLLVLMLALIFIAPIVHLNPLIIIIIGLLISGLFGSLFTLKIGGADMPIAISLLNSLSGVAGAISGLAIGNVLLVSIAGIVGASGLLLTQIMCKAMNRKLLEILLGKTSVSLTMNQKPVVVEVKNKISTKDPLEVIKEAKKVIIIPGYGMAIAQAQFLVKELADLIKKNGASVKFAIHPVAGRMPGHMNVLLAEVDIDYDDLYEMDVINPEFKVTDVAIVIGANDVINPAARDKEGTPIYGMPILNVDEAKHVFIFNYDLKPGYSGVNNSLYQKNNVNFFLGNAKETLSTFINEIKNK